MIAPASTERNEIDLKNGVQFFPVQHIGTFQGLASTMANTYRDYDIALRDSLDNARFMRNDCGVMMALESRMRSVALFPWHIEPENEHSPEQKQLCEEMTKIMDRIPRFVEFRKCLLEAIWFGKYGVQVKYGHDWIGGYRRLTIKSNDGDDCPAWLPVNGDKIVFRHDDASRYENKSGAYPFQVGIRVGVNYKPGEKIMGKYVAEPISQSYRGSEPIDRGMAYFLDRNDRQLLVIHKHMIEDGSYEDILSAGSIHGIGIRSRIYWDWVQCRETLGFLIAYLERTHGGIEIYRYPMGNMEAKREVERLITNREPGRGALMVPIPMGEDASQYGVEVTESGMGGIQQMLDLIENYYSTRITKYILGQELSSSAKATGLGSGVADLHLESLLQVLNYDATNLEETMTTQSLRRLQVANFPSSKGINLKFKIDTEDKNQAERLNAINQAFQMGARIKESDVFDVVGLSAPGPNDRVLQAPGGGDGQPSGDPGPMPPSRNAASVPDAITGNASAATPPTETPERYSYAAREPDLRSAIDRAANATDPNPSDAQKVTGNYRKGQFHWNGWTIAIETPAGAKRRGRNALGLEWEHTIPVHYGYFRRTESEADGDHIDVFVGPDPESPIVFVIDQVKGNGHFDEHKVMIGFTSEKDAIDAYRGSYSPGWTGLRSIHGLTVPQFKAWMEDGDSGDPISGQVSKYARQIEFEWNESDHPRDDAGRFAESESTGTAKKSLKPGMVEMRQAKAGGEGGRTDQEPGEPNRSSEKKGPAGLTVREAIEATGAKGEKLTHKNAVQATYLYTDTTSTDWKAVEVDEMKSVDDGKGGQRMAPQFVFPPGYTQIETPWSTDSASNPCCHLCGTSIKNAYHIQNDETKNTMLVGSECVTQFGEGDNGHQAARKSINAANHDFVTQLHDMRNKLRESGTYEERATFQGKYTGGTARKWSTHTPEGKAIKAMYDRITAALKHTTGEDITPKDMAFRIPSTDRVISNWRKLKGEEAAAALQAASDYLTASDDPEKYAMEWNESQHPREAHKDNLENSWKHMTTDMKEFLVDGHYEALMGIDEQIEAARARKTAVQSNPNV